MKEYLSFDHEFLRGRNGVGANVFVSGTLDWWAPQDQGEGLSTMKRFLIAIASLAAFWLTAASVQAEPFYQGPKKCQECHKAEFEVWEGTKHSKSVKTVHKSDKAKDVVKAVGGKSMKREETCTLCHYTMEQKDADAKPKPRSGPSCESCHGASSDWIEVHNNYGGKDVKREDESAEHKAERMANASAAGMIWPTQLYDVANNCMTCHGLAHPGLEPDTLGKMLEAGHPLKPEFELVQYSQGSVRHRFYPPDVTTNQEMSAAELARMFVTGQAAKLVSASAAMGKASIAQYQEAQQKRIDSASQALGAVSSVPEAAALVADPSEANARALVAAIQDKDLSGEVGGLLPDPGSYK